MMDDMQAADPAGRALVEPDTKPSSMAHAVMRVDDASPADAPDEPPHDPTPREEPPSADPPEGDPPSKAPPEHAQTRAQSHAASAEHADTHAHSHAASAEHVGSEATSAGSEVVTADPTSSPMATLDIAHIKSVL